MKNNKKCPKCGSFDIDIGGVTAHAKRCAHFSSKGSILKPKGCNFKSYLCLSCGYIEIYAENVQSFKDKLQK